MKIFVSYSRRDAGDFAEQIQRHFASFGHYEVFTDVNSIKAGDIWTNTIEDNISSCDIFVVIVTNGALQSPHVETEISQARRDKKKIIPCFHRSVRNNDIKWGLNKIQGVEFEDKFELARNLYSKIPSQNGKKPLEPTPKPKPPTPPRHARKFKSLAIIVMIGVIAAVVGLLFAFAGNNSADPISKGYDLLDSGRYQEAIPYFDRALAIDPNNTDALNGKGYALYGLGRYQEAISFFDKALAIDPDYVYALNGKGNAFLGLERYQEAISFFDKALAIDPDNALVLNNKRLALDRLQ
jgi:tetratricopeptide (TPR) repeat protein